MDHLNHREPINNVDTKIEIQLRKNFRSVKMILDKPSYPYMKVCDWELWTSITIERSHLPFDIKQRSVRSLIRKIRRFVQFRNDLWDQGLLVDFIGDILENILHLLLAEVTMRGGYAVKLVMEVWTT